MSAYQHDILPANQNTLFPQTKPKKLMALTGLEPGTSGLAVQHSNHYTTEASHKKHHIFSPMTIIIKDNDNLISSWCFLHAVFMIL